MDDLPTPPRPRRESPRPACASRLSGWTGAWIGLTVLAGWMLGNGLRPFVAAVSEAIERPTAITSGDATTIGLLVTALIGALGGLVVRPRGSGRRRGVVGWSPGLAWALLAIACGWRCAGIEAGARLPSEVPREGQSFWIAEVERIDWDRSPPSWVGHAFAWNERGRWRRVDAGVPVRGLWARPERGGMLLHASVGRTRTGDAVLLRVDRVYRLTGTEGDGARSVAARMAAARAALCRRVVAALGPDAGALAARTLLGPVPQLPTAWERSFRETGTMHLLSISGFHLTLIGGILWLVLRIVTGGAAWSLWPALLALGGYAYLVGGTAPVLRACGAAYLLAFGPGWGRRHRVWNALGWTAALLPLLDPAVAGTASFQLSFGAMAGVLWGGALPLPRASPAARRNRRRRIWRSFLQAPAQLLCASIGATLLTAPWSLHHFGLIYPLGVAANLLAIPTMAVTLAVQGISVVSIALGAGSGFPFVAIGRACGEGFLAGLGLLAELCARWPWLGSCERSAALAWTVLLGLLLLLLSRGHRRASFRRMIPWLLCAALPVVASTVRSTRREAPFARAAGEVTFLDVGQGDAVLLRLGKTRWLVDLGVGSLGGRRDRLIPALLARGVRRLERVWITHGDSDHWGGLADLLVSPVRVDTLVLPAGAPFPEAFWQNLRAGPRRPCVVRTGAGWSRTVSPGVRARVLHPPDRIGDADERPSSVNAWSLVLLLEGPAGRDGGSIRVLLSGDLEREREAGMMRTWGAGPPVTLAELAHHGSRTAGSEAWWRRARPLLAVISVGAGNVYRLPHPATLEAARGFGATVRRTDQSGAVRCAFAAGRLLLRSERPALPVP